MRYDELGLILYAYEFYQYEKKSNNTLERLVNNNEQLNVNGTEQK